MNKKTILITGGAGYIGSHAIVEFEQAGYQTVTIDNFSNASIDTFHAIEKILGYPPIFHSGDIRDPDFLRVVFGKYSFDGVVHFAGLKSVGESCKNGFLYYHNNIEGTICLCETMEEFSVRRMIFSSSATVYDVKNAPEYIEGQLLGTTNPYGTSKLIIEKILEDLVAHKGWNAISLRYFNPIGAHISGHIGENPKGIPNNLLPYILDVASEEREKVLVFGDDYDTIDGTGVRDYIDVCDLINAHLLAYEQIGEGFEVINIGSGYGTSVLQMISAVEEVLCKKIPYIIQPRRAGDIGEFFCNPDLAKNILGWETKKTLRESIESAWKFAQKRKSKNVTN